MAFVVEFNPHTTYPYNKSHPLFVYFKIQSIRVEDIMVATVLELRRIDLFDMFVILTTRNLLVYDFGKLRTPVENLKTQKSLFTFGIIFSPTHYIIL